MAEEQYEAELLRVAEHFRTRAPEILARWEESIRTTLPAAWHEEELILRNHIPVFLDELATAVLTGVRYQGDERGVAARIAKTLSSSVISSVEHGAQRALLTDYNLGQLLHEYRILRKVTFEVLELEAPRHPATREILNDAIDRAMELAAVEFTRIQQEALALSEAQSRLVMENVPDYAIFMADAEGNVLTWNVGAERLTGYAADRLVKAPLARLCESLEGGACPLEAQLAAASACGSSHAETQWRRADGVLFWVGVTVTALPRLPEHPEAFGVVARDITARREREEATRAWAEDLRLLNQHKDDFLAMLAHELRNPLGAVSNALHVMERAAPGDPAYSRATQIARRQIRHQRRLVEDLLEASRLIRGKVQIQPERLDLAQLVEDSVEDYRSVLEQARVSLTVSVPPQPVWVCGDATRLAQVIGNLLQNAAKFTPPEGSVAVRLRAGEQAVLTVTDTGMGLSPDLASLIFEPFAQADRSLDRSQGGLGLGLALVRGISELHGGTVAATSAGLGQGTEFRVTLPIGEGPAADSEEAAPVEVPAGCRRVLVIEDSYDGAATLQDLLELSGHEVRLAHSGPEGVRTAAAFDPEVVLCDIGLPGMSGYEVAQALRQAQPPSLRVLAAITGYGGDEDRAHSRAAGFDTHLTKPVDVKELQRIVAGAR